MMSTRQAVATIDLGGTHLRSALQVEADHILAQRRIKTPAEGGPLAVLAAMVEQVRALADETSLAPVAVCVAAPGPIDPSSGVVHAAPNLPGWEGFALTERLSEALGIPARANNDANLAALGEALHGAGKGRPNVLYLTVSTGVGGGVVQQGHLLGGSHGLAGELGHVIVRAGGPRCGFGHAGCLEALASGTAVAAAAQRALNSGSKAARSSALAGAVELDARRVADAAREGDALATAILAGAAKHLGLAIGGFVNTFDPDVVVIGGGLGLGAWDLMSEAVAWHAAKVVMSPEARDWRLRSAALGDDAGLVGAAAWLHREQDAA
jgi:glucokinase